MRVTLSNRTHPMLQVFAVSGPYYHMSYEEAQAYDQRPFRALIVHEWIKWSQKDHGFVLTADGMDAWSQFNKTSIDRKDRTRPLASIFENSFYGHAKKILKAKAGKRPKSAGGVRSIHEFRHSA